MTDLDQRPVEESIGSRRLLTSDIGRVLSTPTLSRPFWPPSTPRWILRCFAACDGNVPVRGGVFQVNRVHDRGFQGIIDNGAGQLTLPSFSLAASYSLREGEVVDTSLAAYDPSPQQIQLEVIRAIIKVPTHVPTLYSNAHDQLEWQLKMTGEYIYETKENLVFNHPDYGLLNVVDPTMRFEVDAPPSPDVLDDLLGLAWKRPDCFMMHPRALAEFHKQATAHAQILETVEIFGHSFTTWRGLPICPTNKLHLFKRGSSDQPSKSGGSEADQGDRPPRDNGAEGPPWTTSVLLARLGESKTGVVNLYAADAEADPSMPYISVELMGRSDEAVASYLLTTYSAVAVLSPGALACARVTF